MHENSPGQLNNDGLIEYLSEQPPGMSCKKYDSDSDRVVCAVKSTVDINGWMLVTVSEFNTDYPGLVE